jgi:hypothetical protein
MPTPVLWRVRSPNTAIAGEYMAATQISLYAGGVLQTVSAASASATNGAGWSADKANDANAGTFWTTGASPPPAIGHWWQATLASGAWIDRVDYTSRSDGVREDPVDIFIEYSLDGGGTWDEAWQILGLAAWASNETRSFLESAAADGNAVVSAFDAEVMRAGPVDAVVSTLAAQVMRDGPRDAIVSNFDAEVMRDGPRDAIVSMFMVQVMRTVAFVPSDRRRMSLM